MSGGMWHRTLIYLGLREEPEEGYDELPERFTPLDPAAPAVDRPRPIPTKPGADPADDRGADVRPLHRGDVHVRSVPPTSAARAAVVEVSSFDEVEAVGARYRSGQAVVFDLAYADTVDARRVVDFVSGLTYALDGALTKVGSRAFLLVPDGVHVADDERRRLIGMGYRLPGGGDS